MIGQMKDVSEISKNRFADSPLGKQTTPLEKSAVNNSEVDRPLAKRDATDSPENKKPIQNKQDGLQREREVKRDLEKKYPPEHGYMVLPEVYLRNENGNIVKDPKTGKARRIDFVVVKNGRVISSVEVTSKTADKQNQLAKENRIRENGGNYIRDNNGNLIKMPNSVQTRVERRD